jgi:asparagine synthetase B (glutamine-hydrolysing)
LRRIRWTDGSAWSRMRAGSNSRVSNERPAFTPVRRRRGTKPRRQVALLLSGGLDSLSVGIALQKASKTVHAYTYRVQGYPSRDLKKAIAIARHFCWPLTVVEVPSTSMAPDFVRLAVEHRCRKKVQFEVTFPLLYIFPAIEEAEIWTGWNADDHYGNTKNFILSQKELAGRGASRSERKKAFDAA